MKKTILILAILVGADVTVSAQNENTTALAARYEGENAVMVSNVEHVEIKLERGELKAKSKVDEEILILTDIGASLYNASTVYHSSFNKLLETDGVTLVPNGKGYRTVKSKQTKTVKSTATGVFYDDGQQTIITFAELVKGAKTRSSHTIEHTNIHFLPSYYFQSYLPIAKSEFKVTFPKNVNLRWQLRGKDTNLIKLTKEEGRNTNTYTWAAENLPRFKVFEHAPDVSYYMPHILIYIEDYTAGKNGERKRIFGTVDDLYRFYYPFISDLNKAPSPEISKIVESLTKDAVSEKEKAMRIFQYVQQNIKYIAFEDGMGGFIPREASLVCSRKYGDCKDMASLLVAMCKEAGIKAYYTWIGTRRKPYIYEETPLPVVDNHMICTVNIGAEWIFLDGTDALIPFGVPPHTIQGKEALIGLGRDKYKIIKVPQIAASNNVISDSTYINLTSNTVKGSVNINMKGYCAWGLQEVMQYKSPKEREDAIKAVALRGSNKYLQKSFDYKAFDNREKDVAATSTFEVSDYAQQVGNEWYINMNLQRSYEDLWINPKDRKISLELDYKSRQKQVVVLDVPKGFHVSYLPPAAELSEDKLWSFKIGYKVSEGQVHLVKEYEMNTLYVEPSQFEAHNRLIEELKKHYKESVVLRAD